MEVELEDCARGKSMCADDDAVCEKMAHVGKKVAATVNGLPENDATNVDSASGESGPVDACLNGIDGPAADEANESEAGTAQENLNAASSSCSSKPGKSPTNSPKTAVLAKQVEKNGKSDSEFSEHVAKNSGLASVGDDSLVTDKPSPMDCDTNCGSGGVAEEGDNVKGDDTDRKCLETLLTKNVKYSQGHIVENEDGTNESVKSQKTTQRAKKSAGPSKPSSRGFVKKFPGTDIMTINLAPIANVKLKLPNVDDAASVKRTGATDKVANSEPILPNSSKDDTASSDREDEKAAETESVNSSSKVKKCGAKLYTITGKRRKVSPLKRKRRRKTGTYKLPQIHSKKEYKRKLGTALGREANNNSKVKRDDGDDVVITVMESDTDTLLDESLEDAACDDVATPQRVSQVGRQEQELKRVRVASPILQDPDCGPSLAKRARIDRMRMTPSPTPIPLPRSKNKMVYTLQRAGDGQASPKIINVVSQANTPCSIGEPVKCVPSSSLSVASLPSEKFSAAVVGQNNVVYNSNNAVLQNVVLVPISPSPKPQQVSLLGKGLITGTNSTTGMVTLLRSPGMPNLSARKTSPMILNVGSDKPYVLTPMPRPPSLTPQKSYSCAPQRAYKMISTSSPLHVTSQSQLKRAINAARPPPPLRKMCMPTESSPTPVPSGVVTPPRSPCTVVGAATPSDKKPDVPLEMDLIPLCACKVNGASFANLGQVTYCQALDSTDGKILGCCNKVTNAQLVRPAVKIPFMACCEVHRKRLRMHQCCPGCGHFCTQGKFYQCKKEGGNIIHHFHKQCQVFKDGKFYCPHCGEDSEQFEVSLQLNEPRSVSSFFAKPEDAAKAGKAKARMAMLKRHANKEEKEKEKSEYTFKIESTEKVLSADGLAFGPTRLQLESMLTLLEADFRPKKLRFVPKNLYPYSRMGDLEKVLYMLAEGFDPNCKYEEHGNQVALHAAAASGYVAVAHCLIQAGGDSNAQDNELITPLMKAAEKNHMEVVDILIKAGAVVDSRADDGMTCIHIAAREGHMDIVKYLLDTEKISINVLDDGGWTPLIWAAEYRRINIVKYLLHKGADVNIKDNEENIALHWAAFSGSADIAEIFLHAGCDLESANEHGDRPLHIASRQDHYECVVLFLARGADVEGKNNENDPPIACCTDQNSPTWMALKVNRQLRSFAEKRLERPEKLIHRDLSFGKEKNPIPCVNGCDDEQIPKDYLYVMENIETSPMNINRCITSLQSCACEDDCSSHVCVCSRNSVRCWYDKEGHLIKDFNQMEPPLLFECNHNCRCWTTCNNRVVQNGITCRLQLFRTRGRGWGVRTLLDIPQGTFLCEYIGEIISDSEADRREDDSYLFDLDNKDGETYCIDARKYGNVARFINHLCEPNIVPVKVFIDHQDLRFPRICFFSSREIKAGEELGFDYGEKFWIIKWKQFTCACGSARCKYSREVIQKTLAEYHARMEEELALEQQILALS
ncbi:histone-lysine N-methyltransferase EHMT2-like [Lineus longissimus]|uniref:histone-lysine N-methyltransferase EHMT2-like n=1 Tax=Lineus longissimus TaxID=88925 RepID=UPI002B4DBC10